MEHYGKSSLCPLKILHIFQYALTPEGHQRGPEEPSAGDFFVIVQC